jgi:mannose-1-phosphate guanylyltransferase
MTEQTRPRRANALWSIVLAAGQGKRLAPITRALCGRWLPKQYVALTTRRTLIQETVERVAPLVPPMRTVAVVSEQDQAIARTQLADYPGVEIVPQPQDRGTAAGLLLGLAHVRARDPQADVAIFPADHHVQFPLAWANALRQTRFAAHIASSGIALMGAPADRPATDLGWIVPGARLSATFASEVREFVEKPPFEQARRLLSAGGLWNTMVVVGRVSALWRLARGHIPAVTQHFERYLAALSNRRAYQLLTLHYQRMPVADLSRHVLQVASGLAVVPVVGSGWFDCGTPERLTDWLAATSDPCGVLARLDRARAAGGLEGTSLEDSPQPGAAQLS